MFLKEKMEHVQQLELIHDLKYLGLSCFFQDEIKQMLGSIYNEHKCFHNNEADEEDLYFIALGFRLLRQHGFDVSQEVFDCFKNEKGSDFKKSLGQDTKGMLQLYEASFLFRQGEDTLELARAFATKSLQKKVDEGDEIDDNLLSWIRHSLDLPYHWRIQRLEATWFLDAYARRPDMNPLIFGLLEWVDLVRAYLKEAKWYYSGYTPRLDEYLSNAKTSIGSPNLLSQPYFTFVDGADKKAIESLYQYHNILYLSGRISRLVDDLGTAQHELERGDVPKAIQCYMNDKNALEEEAREHVRFLIGEAWKEMNMAMAAGSPFPDDLVEAAAILEERRSLCILTEMVTAINTREYINRWTACCSSHIHE